MNEAEYEESKKKITELQAKLAEADVQIAALKGKDFKKYSELSRSTAFNIRIPLVKLMAEKLQYEKEHGVE